MTLAPTLLRTSLIRWGWLILSACLYLLLGYNTTRSQFSILIGLYLLLLWSYSLRIRPLLASSLTDKTLSKNLDRFLFSAAVFFRFLLLLDMPALSDDYARFIWDGRLLLAGINPFNYLPVELMAGGVATSFVPDPSLYQLLNSPNYYTVYPPLNQALFALATELSPHSLLGSVIWLRVPILLTEIGSLWLMGRLLSRAGRDPNLALLYGLNPLVILELTGNVHFEAVMLFFVLLAVWLWQRYGDTNQGLLLSAGALALAICTKLLPLLLLPVIVAQLGWRRGIQYSAVVGVVTILLFLPFFDSDMIRNMLESIDLYFRMFEFNASIYYLIRAVGYWLMGYNVLSKIGLWISIFTTITLISIAFWRRHPPVVRVLWMLTIYFAMATTVHPWYITSLVMVTVFTVTHHWQFRYPLLWSGLVWLSYSAYRQASVREDNALLIIEYGTVSVFLVLEIYRYNITCQHHAQTPVEV
jgi:alpha-1,6-mannosyltransferase